MATGRTLSPAMAGALAAATDAGALVRRHGGFWTTPDAQPVAVATAATQYDQWSWFTSTGTVRALEARGLLRFEDPGTAVPTTTTPTEAL